MENKTTQESTLHPDLVSFVVNIVKSFDLIPNDRKAKLEGISQYITKKIAAQDPVKMVVICTHNARRSHLGQAWLQVAAQWYQVGSLIAYSGGTEATAFHPNAIQALREVGWKIEPQTNTQNPVYEASYGATSSLQMFSKAYDHEANPAGQFAALMVCTQADQGCPIVTGAEARFSIPYEDPKAFDNTEFTAAKYAERSQEIAREMFYILSKVS